MPSKYETVQEATQRLADALNEYNSDTGSYTQVLKAKQDYFDALNNYTQEDYQCEYLQ